jgi:hypothetical protein
MLPRLARLSGSSSHAQLQMSLLLQGADDAEEIVGARVSPWSQHGMQALARLVDLGGKVFESDSHVDQVAQDRLAFGRVPLEIGVDCLGEDGLTESGVAARARCDRLLEVPVGAMFRPR